MFDELGRWLDGCDADILCLQEVTHTPTGQGWTRFDDAERSLPQRADLLADVRSRLPHHHGLFTASDSGPVRDHEGAEHRQDFGVATFVAEGLPVVGLRSAFVHGTYIDHREWPSDGRPRAALAVRVFDRRGRRFVTVVNLHGLRDAGGKGDTPARRVQAERLVDLVDGVREEGDLTVVCGDLNLLPGSETFRILGGRLGLTELVRESDTRTSRYPKPVRHASYLLVSDPAAVKHFEVVATPEVSDHRALLLELTQR